MHSGACLLLDHIWPHHVTAAEPGAHHLRQVVLSGIVSVRLEQTVSEPHTSAFDGVVLSLVHRVCVLLLFYFRRVKPAVGVLFVLIPGLGWLCVAQEPWAFVVFAAVAVGRVRMFFVVLRVCHYFVLSQIPEKEISMK